MCRSGYEMEMLKTASSMLDFRYTITNPPDLAFGSLVNGVWTGQIGEVANGHVDFIIGVFVITADRLEVPL